MGRQAGFTLIETLVGATIASVVIWVLVAMASRTIGWAASLNARVNGQAGAARLIERLSSEAASAWAVSVPATDALGNSNADGHEVDFFAEDGSHRPYAWAYNYVAGTRTITRYALVTGAAPAAGDTIGDIDGFSGAGIRVTALAADPLFAGATAPDVPFSFGIAPGAIGGNRLVAVQIDASGVDRSVLLANAGAPTAFTVVVNYTPSPAPLATATPAPLILTAPPP
jgi:type II secretory pathway pseudopilin PulG